MNSISPFVEKVTAVLNTSNVDMKFTANDLGGSSSKVFRDSEYGVLVDLRRIEISQSGSHKFEKVLSS